MAIQEQNIYRTSIDGYASDGSGVARIEGMVVFVKGAVRGETADVFIEHVGHNARNWRGRNCPTWRRSAAWLPTRRWWPSARSAWTTTG